MKFGKEEVAVRQLDTAIRLLFHRGDVVSVHTLACAAARVLHDLLNAKGSESWREIMATSQLNMTKGQVYQMLTRAQNFFKHADKDPEDELDFDEKINDDMILVATLEYGELLSLGAPSGRTKTTIPMSVFQLWHCCTIDPKAVSDDPRVDIAMAANMLFPGLKDVPRDTQLARGAKMLRHAEARGGL